MSQRLVRTGPPSASIGRISTMWTAINDAGQPEEPQQPESVQVALGNMTQSGLCKPHRGARILRCKICWICPFPALFPCSGCRARLWRRRTGEKIQGRHCLARGQ
ncbi:hypothetical protein BDN72DRAFT_831109 [Pluteus cervinus]|uniref:Uncharacterized protein n=1 Tax=Pluteus cervinus TaxID=181527 RepID=A0ACD3BES0_9AGAR|nr:hypothetical protein BDN72DRAFT_831109 [Pluteus cervinus]